MIYILSVVGPVRTCGARGRGPYERGSRTPFCRWSCSSFNPSPRKDVRVFPYPPPRRRRLVFISCMLPSNVLQGEPVCCRYGFITTKGSRPSHFAVVLGDNQMPEPPSTKPPSASYLSRIRRSFVRSSPGVSSLSELASSFSCPLRNLRTPRATAPAAQVVKVHASKPASGGRAGKQTAERLHPPSSLLERAAAKVQVAWRARADSKAQVATQR